MWSLLDHLPATHTVKTLGKLDYRSGGHTVMNRVADRLAGVRRDREADLRRGSVAVLHRGRTTASAVTKATGQGRPGHRLSGGTGSAQAVGQQALFPDPQHRAGACRLSHQPLLARQDSRGGRGHPADGPDRPSLPPLPAHAKAWRYGFDDETVRQVRRIYFAMCAEADAMVGALYEAMQRLGLAEGHLFRLFQRPRRTGARTPGLVQDVVLRRLGAGAAGRWPAPASWRDSAAGTWSR
jgi:hypothetical protein